MPNTVITSTANAIKFVFNDDDTITGYAKGAYRINHIVEVEQEDDHITIIVDATHRIQLSNAANTDGYLLVDSVDAVAPASLSDLYDKIVALID